MFAEFHFIRPEWLLGIFPLWVSLWLYRRSRQQGGQWQHFCDEALIPYVVTQQRQTLTRDYRQAIMFLAGLLTVIALAGPTWERKPMPLFRDNSALVVLLDLSRSMDAQDLRPNRLVRARHKLHDLLKQRKGGQTALIVYAAQPYVVTPLTDDSETIIALLGSLSTQMMPQQGSRADLAIAESIRLLNQSGVSHGQVLLLTDGIISSQQSQINTVVNKLKRQGHLLSVISIGSDDGAPIPIDDGGFLKDRTGSIVVAKLDEAPLQDLAKTGGGIYSRIQIDEKDIAALNTIENLLQDEQQLDKTIHQGEEWQDAGPWLLILIVPMVALLFRQGFFVVLLVLILPLSRPVHAFEWAQLWQNDNQQGAALMEQKNYQEAAKTFTDKRWQAGAHYRQGEYDKSLEVLQGFDGVEDEYNRGNSYAMSGDYHKAIQSYKRVLEMNKAHEDAAYNLKQLEEMLRQQQRQKQQSDKSDEQSQQGDSEQSDQNDSDPGESEQDKGEAEQNQQSDQNEPSSSQNGQPDSSSNAQQYDSKQDDEGETEQQSEQASPSEEPQDNQEAEAPLTQSQTDQEQVQDSENEGLSSTHSEMTSEQQQALEQWLRRIPDDPGGLLRRKFQYQYQRQYQNSGEESQAW